MRALVLVVAGLVLPGVFAGGAAADYDLRVCLFGADRGATTGSFGPGVFVGVIVGPGSNVGFAFAESAYESSCDGAALVAEVCAAGAASACVLATLP